MDRHVVLLSVPGLRETDLQNMPSLMAAMTGGGHAELVPSFPCVTCPVQVNMTTGRMPREHGIVANGLYDREKSRCEMWTSPNTAIERPQVWEVLAGMKASDGSPLRSAVWFPLHSKHSKAEYVCTPAPIHNPDGTESLWCYTKPTELYGTLRDQLGHFPLQHFWGPMTNIAASQWIADSAVYAARQWRPHFFYIYLPHLDYQAQRFGPDSEQAQQAVVELDTLLGPFFEQMAEAYGQTPDYLVAGEYAITAVDHVVYPNRILRDMGLLNVLQQDDGTELLDLNTSKAWAMADHQHAQLFVRDQDATVIQQIIQTFTGMEGIAEAAHGSRLAELELDHERCGDVVLVSTRNSWQAYYWWNDDRYAPRFARTVDIHRKPGYDAVELFIDRETKSIPLDASLIQGSHGAPAIDPDQKTVLLSSRAELLGDRRSFADTDLYQLVLDSFKV